MEREGGVDIEKVREFIHRKEEKRKQALDARFQRATADCDAIVSRVIHELRPTRVYQWGSLLDRSRFTEMSDIDIALEGLEGPEAYFGALGIAMELTEIPVDIVEIERLPQGIADRIRHRGRLVYEQKGS